jgi:hypothetical protein
VAREEPWRSTWRTSCKTGTPVFDSPTAQFTENQKRLIYWSMVYDNVFESLECPTDDVVGNDDLLDLWFENQHEKSQKNKSKSGADSSLVTTNEKILGASEIFVPVDSKEDALNVYNELNTPEVRRNFQQKQKEIETKKEVKEQDLSQTKQQLRMMANQEGFRKNK